MNENDKIKKRPLSSISVGIGGTLIMVIFVVLCLTIFAVLSFTVAYSDLKLSNKTSEITKDYYYTNAKAEEKLSIVYEKLLLANDDLLSTNVEGSYAKNFNVIATNKLYEIEDISLIKKNEEDIYSEFAIYYEALGDFNQKICVNLDILYDEIKNEPYYEISSWNLTNIEIPSYGDDNMNLWEGN